MAAQGNNSGLCDVGYCYRNGHGVAQDYAKALLYYQKAANQGCPTAAYWLAYAYAHSQGVKQDLALARNWYEIARQRGDPDSADALIRLARIRQ